MQNYVAMSKRAFLIHGLEGVPEGSWRPWLKNELEKRRFAVFIPAIPDTNRPEMNAWVNYLAKVVGDPDRDCYIGGVILVAGFTSNLGFKELESFFTKLIEWEKIKSHCDKFVAIHSDNDYYVSLHYADLFKENLGAEVLIQHNSFRLYS